MSENHRYYRHIFWGFLGFLFSFLLLTEFFGSGRGMKPITFILMLSGFILAGLLITKLLSFFGLYEDHRYSPGHSKKGLNYKSLLWAFLGVVIGSVFADLSITGGYYCGIVWVFVFWSGILIWIGLGIFRRIKRFKIKSQNQLKNVNDISRDSYAPEGLEAALKRDLGDLEIKVDKKGKAEPDNPNQYEVKFFRSQEKRSKPSFCIKAEVPSSLKDEFFRRMALLYNIPLSWSVIRREFSQKIEEEILYFQSSPIDIEYLGSPNYAASLKAIEIAQNMYRRGEIKREEVISKMEELYEKFKNNK